MVTVGNQGRDDRYIRLWRGNISLPAVSRSCCGHVFDKAFRSIMEDNREQLNRLSYGNLIKTVARWAIA